MNIFEFFGDKKLNKFLIIGDDDKDYDNILKLKNILKSKYFTKPDIKNLTITIDERMVNFQNGNYFDEFVEIFSPYFQEGKKRSIKIRIPFKHHSHSRKFFDWERKKSIAIKQFNKDFMMILFWEKETPQKRESNKALGIDQGFKKLIVDSNGKLYGTHLEEIYKIISRKTQGSKKFKKKLIWRTNEAKKVINEFFEKNKDISILYIEDLKEVRKHSSMYHKTMNKVQRWIYRNSYWQVGKFLWTEWYSVNKS